MRNTLLTCLLLVLTGAAGRQTVEIKGMQFSPAEVTIHRGDTLTWHNADEQDHTATAIDGSFDSGRIGAGESFSFTFKKAGQFKYGCAYHPRMKGVVMVGD